MKNWLWIFILLAGLVLGGFIGDILAAYPGLTWLGYGKEFGINTGSPMVLNFYVLSLTFGLTIRINIASIIGVFLSMLGYKLFAR
jgi:hypothetical protein